MMKHILALIIACIVVSSATVAQKSQTLFTVGDVPVSKSEFEYIYSKTNGDNADFSKESLEEYLDLYVKFKLKVKRAKDMQLDTIPALNQELEGYRRQLADSYLMDKEVTERLIEEAYERKKLDVDIAHILIRVPVNADAAAIQAAKDKAYTAKKRIEAGTSFGDVATEFSQDKSVKRNYGRIGFVTALFPNGYYALETAAYEQKIGILSDPIRTDAGWHILKVFERRPARGEIEAAHILRRVDKTKVPKRHPKAVIDSVYAALNQGGEFAKMAKIHSEDRTTAPKGGYVGFFGINRFEKAFENAAFALKNDGDYSEPFETSAGWHIIQRISKKGLEPYNIERSRLQAQIKKDSRFQEARQAMIVRIQKDGNLRENKKALNAYIATLDSTFLTYKWKPTETPQSKQALIELGSDFKQTIGDFADYLGRASRKRLRMARQSGNEDAVMQLYADFLDEKTLQFEEKQLEKKYPEFKNLMREYEEGILLFEATKLLVWDKASQDTAGLKAFYETAKEKYQWGDRVETTTYIVPEKHAAKTEEIRQFAAKHTPKEVQEKFNTGTEIVVRIKEEKTFEKGRNEDIDKMNWKASEMTLTAINGRDRSRSFTKIEKTLAPARKTLDEARGYVVADYQDLLEKQWIEQLRKDYPVKINQKVLKGMTK